MITQEAAAGISVQLKSEIARVFEAQQNKRLEVSKSTAKVRIAKLKRLHKALLESKAEMKEALFQDLRRNPTEADLVETYAITSEIKHAVSHLKKWMRPKRVPTPMALLGTRSWITYEARGNALIISPWNYPVNLSLGPLVSAIAAGNTAIIKPSEYTPHTAAFLKKFVSKVFPEDEVAVFEGDYRVATELLDKPFHHIFFTGSPEVGKIVMKAASKHLASITMELGGKSPVIVDETADAKVAASRISWAKFLNKGQTCIAPDYIYVHESKLDAFISEAKKSIQKLYGETETDRKESSCYARIVNEKHFNRVNHLLQSARGAGAKIHIGGEVDAEERYISPTLITGVSLDSPIMQEEIFGPLLPIISYRDLEEPIREINSREKPLALYIYSQSNRNVDHIIRNTSSGGTVVNDNGIQFLQVYLPFGGVNNSGIGEAHGWFGFKAFSHSRSIVKQPFKLSTANFLMPPYNAFVQKMTDLTIKYF
jgi:aldehyde dehydrogenase (NAD+)